MTPKPITENKNAAVSVGSGGAGIVAIYLLGLAGVSLTPELGGVIAGSATTVVLAIGRDGIRGVMRRLWNGSN